MDDDPCTDPRAVRRTEPRVYVDPAPWYVRLRVYTLLILIAVAAIWGVSTCMRRKSITTVPSMPSGPVRISCVGDSITYGYGLRNRDEECWVSLLPSLLPEGTTTANYGVSGSFMMQDGYFPWRGTSAARAFWEAEEDVVIIMLGTNDVCNDTWDAAAYERDYQAFVEEVQAKKGNPAIVLMTPPALHMDETYPWLVRRLEDEAIPAIQRVAQHTGAGVIDLYTFTESHPEWFDDGVHPNAEGDAAMAAFIAEQLQAI